jgi:type IV pilus assembly protein PilQ
MSIAARIMFAGLILMLCTTLSAEQTPPDTAATGTQGSGPGAETKDPVAAAKEEAPVPLVTVEWRDKSLRAALEYIAEAANVNIVPGFTVTSEDTVTVTFRSLEWKLALDEVVKLSKCVLEEVSPKFYRVEKPPTVTMSFKNNPLEEVIRAIATLANINIIIADDVRGNVTMMFKDVPWMEALQSIIKTTGYAIVQEKYDIIRVIKTETMQDQLETRMFQLKYLKPPGDFKATIATTYAVGAPKPASDPIKDFTLLSILKNMLTKKGGSTIGSLEYDRTSSTIIIKDTKPTLDEIGKIIEKLDVPPPQVLVELKFVVTSNDDLLNFGVNYAWGGSRGVGAYSRFTSGSDTMAGATAPRSGQIISALPFGRGKAYASPSKPWFLTNYDITATLRLFKQDNKSRLIQEPTLLTLHGQEATVFVGEQISFAQTTASSSQSGTIAYSIGEAAKSPAKQGFQLWMVPYVIKETNQVMMTLIPQQEILTGRTSSVPGFDRYTLNSGTGEQYIDLPRIQQSTMVVYLLLENGQGTIIGGLSRDSVSKEVEKVPYLGDIPVLNIFFKNQSDRHTVEHLLIFLTPHIIRSSVETAAKLSKRVENSDAIMEKK